LPRYALQPNTDIVFHKNTLCL